MDSVELARQVAAELYARLVASGADPWSPYDFAVAEAKRRGIDVEPTAAGAAVLNGGRATFVAADDLIIHENIGSRFEQAFLVAHEIGHVELGDDPDGESAPTIDPARAAEPSPVGMDRVVDYGRKQRREVQMDLFARELLLPRPVARVLHVDEGLSASAIAAKLGAPFDVVAQQLLDALLLPPIPPTTAAAHVERPMNPLQAAAAAHRGEAYLLEAGPGTGKTQTLIARVEGLLEEDVDPRRILLLTFSNKAAGEMAERIARKRPDAAAAMWIGTFHAFGLDIIRRFHAELGLPKDPRMMDRTEAVELLEEEFLRLRFAHYRNLYDPTQIIADMLAAVSRAKDEVVDAETYAEFADAMLAKAGDPAAREAAERAGEVARVYAAYEQLKRNAHCIDFGDLVALPVQLLENDAAICAVLQAQYDHVLVDEYQDVNRSSVRLLSALRLDGRNLWMVGDAKQSIYRFRGASSFNMTRFGKEDFSGGKRGRLKRNYRSVPEIVDSFSSFAVTMRAGDADSGLEAERDANGHKPELRTVQRAEQQQVALADAIEELRREGYAYRDQAVLCTGNEKLSTIGQDLERLGVPVLFLGSLFERGEVKDLLALLSILVDRRAMGLVRIACWPEFATCFADVVAVFDHLRAAEHAPASWLRHSETIPGLTDAGRQTLAKLAAALDGFDQTASPWTVLATLLLDRTRIAAHLGTSEDLADRTRGIAIWQFLNFVRVQPAGRGLPITRLLDRVRRLVRLGDDRDLRQLPAAAQHLDAVRLMTIHGAKGLEFGGVHIPGLNSDTIPRTPPAPPCPAPDGMIAGAEGSAIETFRAGQAEEQECLFYVAQSRARDRLILYAPTEKSNGHNRPLSPFLDRLRATVTRRSIVPARPLPMTAEARGVDLVVDGRLSFGASQIALYESCPRRFFYTHVLQVGGRRTATAFMHLHEAVRSVVEAVIASAGPMSQQALEDLTDAALAGEELADHGYSADFRALALEMLHFFLSSRAGTVAEAPVAVSVMLDGEEILVRPDEVLVRPDGVRAVRRVRTGHILSTESKDLGAAALILAVEQAFPGAVAELVHLSDGQVSPLALSKRELDGRRGKLAKFLGDIRAGRFPAEVSSRTCPNCPAFFICGPTPDGPLQKKFA
ncbi:MAG: ImmA/IrrE family metallo-endopeptidase [Mesorhizobium sp.]|uniref:UvrD-helicase domain-containing protein n=1 Tax=Mesorhizobium sp. TaxID=1871066 RepID=UPI000FE78F21|nr:UvrD-helicase domain-containing protein [Mesorhizobium sp.]RWH94139.1 MAG: ImmA/IrrE family metallo-endopeptidase [Mesorhizobium sp.]RWK82768.1 MAG: ImmA/IrrE family metallo-endopeptidase [Mesorhizobium sp.]RWL06576.1 MAG: ImmA/IrrE family metallo-endopeptidase [Mesorhizobium sp.]